MSAKIKASKGDAEYVSAGIVNRRDTLLDIGQHKSQAWLVSFTDVMALMLTFFVLLFSLSNPDRELFSNITFSLKENAGYSASYNSGNTNLENTARRGPSVGQDLDYLVATMKQKAANSDLLSSVEIQKNNHEIILKLPSTLLFHVGGYEITPEVRKMLREIFQLFEELENTVGVYGYTDPSPVGKGSGFYTTNQGLAQQRALSVAEVLYTVGYNKPITTYGFETHISDLKDFSKQRRVDIHIYR